MGQAVDMIKEIPYKKVVSLDSPYEEDKRTVYHAWVMGRCQLFARRTPNRR